MPTPQPFSVHRSIASPARLTRVPAPPISPFCRHIKNLRQRFGGKQWWLAYVAGCSDAAVSYWESGKRIPAAATLTRIVDALTDAGATPDEMATLTRRWLDAKSSRGDAKRGRAVARPPQVVSVATRAIAGRNNRLGDRGAPYHREHSRLSLAVAERKSVR